MLVDRHGTPTLKDHMLEVNNVFYSCDLLPRFSLEFVEVLVKLSLSLLEPLHLGQQFAFQPVMCLLLRLQVLSELLL